jgi:hypothetical protein
MTTQTNLDLTDKHPTALMRLEAFLIELRQRDIETFIFLDEAWNDAIDLVIKKINELKPSELADLKQSFCEGGIESESAETWSKKWGQTEPNQP